MSSHRHSLFKSFAFAFTGIAQALRTQRNLRIHLAITIAVVAAGLFFKISAPEWVALLLCIGLVFSAELFNTALEHLADRVTTEHDEHIGRAKDAAAAGVLITAIVAVIVGAIVFLPRIVTLITSEGTNAAP